MPSVLDGDCTFLTKLLFLVEIVVVAVVVVTVTVTFGFIGMT